MPRAKPRFESIDEAKAKIEAWRLEYNESRPVKSGSIATGHPFAATGARIVATLAETISETGRGRGPISICAAGGQAVTAVIEK